MKYKKVRKNKPETNVEGSFDCQQCGEYVRGAHYDAKERVLVWTCSEGHESFIEEFAL